MSEVPNLFSAEEKGSIAEDCRKDAKAAKKEGSGSLAAPRPPVARKRTRSFRVKRMIQLN